MRVREIVECDCGNEARYVSQTGELTCAICPLKRGEDSIRIADVPALLAWSRDVLAGGAMGGSSFEALREIIGRKP